MGSKTFFPKTLYQCNIDAVCSKNKHPEKFVSKEKKLVLTIVGIAGGLSES